MLLHKKNPQRTSKLQELLVLQPFSHFIGDPYGLMACLDTNPDPLTLMTMDLLRIRVWIRTRT
jgi:hypothetical protein